MKASELKKMLSTIVAEHLKTMLPGMIKEVLSEMYVRKIVSEHVGRDEDEDVVEAPSFRRPLGEVLGVPAPRQSSVDRARIRAAVVEDDGPRALPEFFSEKNPMRDLYEGMRPLDESASQPGDVDLSMLGLDVGKMKKIVETVDRRSASNRGDHVSSSERSRKIAESMKVG